MWALEVLPGWEGDTLPRFTPHRTVLVSFVGLHSAFVQNSAVQIHAKLIVAVNQSNYLDIWDFPAYTCLTTSQLLCFPEVCLCCSSDYLPILLCSRNSSYYFHLLYTCVFGISSLLLFVGRSGSAAMLFNLNEILHLSRPVESTGLITSLLLFTQICEEWFVALYGISKLWPEFCNRLCDHVLILLYDFCNNRCGWKYSGNLKFQLVILEYSSQRRVLHQRRKVSHW